MTSIEFEFANMKNYKVLPTVRLHSSKHTIIFKEQQSEQSQEHKDAIQIRTT